MVYAYQTLEVTQRTSILEVTINNPPVNVMTLQLYSDLVEFTEQVEQDDSVNVVVFQSANPDFFIAHFECVSKYSRFISFINFKIPMIHKCFYICTKHFFFFGINIDL